MSSYSSLSPFQQRDAFFQFSLSDLQFICTDMICALLSKYQRNCSCNARAAIYLNEVTLPQKITRKEDKEPLKPVKWVNGLERPIKKPQMLPIHWVFVRLDIENQNLSQIPLFERFFICFHITFKIIIHIWSQYAISRIQIFLSSSVLFNIPF